MRRTWKSIIQPHQDYCSVLWAPYGQSHGQKGDLLEQEGPLRAFTKCAYGLRHIPYWEWLSQFKLFSIERRNQRYRCLYIWKIINGKVPDCGLLKLNQNRNTRSGVNYVPITLDGYSESFKSKQRDSLLHSGVNIYNSLPTSIRKITGDLIEFKYELDRYLSLLPDQPPIPGSIPGARDSNDNPSNSIIDWARIIDVSG